MSFFLLHLHERVPFSIKSSMLSGGWDSVRGRKRFPGHWGQEAELADYFLQSSVSFKGGLG